jgi:hypothetical protein
MMNPRHRFSAAALVIAALAFGLGDADATTVTVNLSAGRDNTLYESATGAWSNGAGAHIFAGSSADGDKHRALIAFDIAELIPVGATIQDVNLTLHLSRTSSPAHTVTLHPVTSAWGEGTSNAGGNEGGGAAAAPGDATWIHAFYDTTPWAQPGGDFSATASASADVAGIGFYSWTDPQMVIDVQTWLDNPGANHGWLLLGNESAIRTSKRFDSRENADPAVRPVLVVEYMENVPVETRSWTTIKAFYR